MTSSLLKLENRAVIRLSGPDARDLLQGLVTNDVTAVSNDGAVYAALLTPQGKFMFDMIIVADRDDLLLDVEASRKDDLLRRLMMYKLRAEVTITDEPSLTVFSSIASQDSEGTGYKDPRHEDLGWRLIAADTSATETSEQSLADYEIRRLRAGVPDGSRDMKIEKDFWLETDAERLNGVSFTKGCFVGQELTARMKHRTTLKKRLSPVIVAGGAEHGAQIKTGDDKTAGEIRTSHGDNAIAYLRLEYLDTPMFVSGKPLTVVAVTE